MTVPSCALEGKDAHGPVGSSGRLRVLVAVHLAMGMVPAATSMVPSEVRFMPVILALTAIPAAQWALLCFWAGLGTSRWKGRLVGTLLGVAYLTFWPVVSQMLSRQQARTSLLAEYMVGFAVNAFLVSLFAGGLFLARRWIGALHVVSGPDAQLSHSRFQYSILHLLVITAVLAVLLGLTRSARAADTPGIGWRYGSILALTAVAFLGNIVCAAWATLGRRSVVWPIALVLLVAVLVGIDMALAARLDVLWWWLVPSMALATTLCTTIVATSLLVVRSCGYRL